MISKNLLPIPGMVLFSVLLNMAGLGQGRASPCNLDKYDIERIEKSLVAFVVEDDEEEKKVVGTGFVLNIFGDIAAPKHVLIDKGRLKNEIRVQFAESQSMNIGEFSPLRHSLGLDHRDWVILKKKYKGKPEFAAAENEYAFLNIAHERHVEDTPGDGFVWRVDSVKNRSIEVNRSSIDWMGPHPELPGIFQLTMKGYGGDSGSVYISNCSGDVHGIFWRKGNRDTADFDHTAALMELALDQVVDFDTPQGIFRGESDRRDHRKSIAFWEALQAQLDFTDRELNLPNWTVKISKWSVVGNDEDDFALQLRIGYKRIPRSSQTKQQHPKDNFLYNAWVCFVWDEEIAEQTCIQDDSQRYKDKNSFEWAADPDNGRFVAEAPVRITIDDFRSRTEELREKYNRDFMVEDIKGILVMFEPKYHTFNRLRYYDKQTGYPRDNKIKPRPFSAVYEACIPSVKKFNRTPASLIATSNDDGYQGVLEKDLSRLKVACVADLFQIATDNQSNY